ncbi:MAG: O-antigen ligase family protein [Clostridia bacterium]|nr:O-antigen ligase family protein [Clostridia bacterium]
MIAEKKIRISQILVFLGLVSFFRPTIFEKYTWSNTIFNLMLCFSLALCAAFVFLDKNRNKSRLKLLFILFYALMTFSTFYNKASFSRMLMYVLVGVFSIYFVEFIIRYEFYYSTRVMRALYWLFLILNIGSIFMFPEGITQTGTSESAVWFLGQSTRFAYFYIPALLFCYLGDIYAFKKIRTNTIVLYFLSLLSVALTRAMGATLALAALLLFFVLGKTKLCNGYLFFGSQIAVYVGLTYFSIQEYFENFLVTVLGKDITMSSRTLIWRQVIPLVEENLFWGVGVMDNETMKRLFGFVHTHNHLLQVTFQVGYVGLFVFCFALLGVLAVLQKKKDFYISKVLMFFIFMMGIMLLVDTVDGIRNYYLFVILMGLFINEIKALFDRREQRENG